MFGQNKPKESNLLRVYQLAQKDIKGFYKSLVFILILAGLFAFNSLFVLSLFRNFSISGLISVSVLFLLNFALLSLFALSSRFSYLFWGLVVFSFAIFTPIFISKVIVWWFWYLLIVTFGLLVLYCLNIRSEAGALIGLKWDRIIRRGSIFLSWLIIIILIFFFYFSFYKETDVLKLKIVNGLDYLLSKTAKTSLKESDKNTSTVNDLIRSFIKNQNLLNLPQQIKANFEESLVQETRKNFSQFIGLELKGNETLSQVIVDFLVIKYNQLKPEMRWVFYLLIFIILLSVVSFFNFIFSSLLVIFSWILKEILTSFKIINIEYKGIEKEFLSLE